MASPNIIFLHSHNTGRFIQPYGHYVPTPNLQQLANEGVLFRQAYAAAPTCSPSRASFLTGECPHSAGMLGLAHLGWSITEPAHHMASFLKDAGYRTVLCGVEHTAPHGSNDTNVVGYDEVLSDGSSHAKDVAPRVVDFLNQAPAEPFFLSVGLNETHIPFPDPDPESYPAEDERYSVPPRPLPDTPEIRQMTAAFKASARAMDDAWGSILEALDRKGLSENTLVCCFADHGLQFPLNMCNLTDHGTAVYLIARGPGGFRGGRVVDALVSLMDLAPTACELAGMPAPEWLQGRSLCPLLSGEVDSLHDELFAEVTYHAAYEPQRSVRTSRYKLIRRYDGRDQLVLPNADDTLAKDALLDNGWRAQPRHQEMLFDVFFDPDEVNNLIDDPDLDSVRDDLRQRLDTWMRDTNDPLLIGPVSLAPGMRIAGPDDQSPGDIRIVG